MTIEHKCGNDKAIQVIPPQEHKAIQVSHVAHYRSKFVQEEKIAQHPLSRQQCARQLHHSK